MNALQGQKAVFDLLIASGRWCKEHGERFAIRSQMQGSNLARSTIIIFVGTNRGAFSPHSPGITLNRQREIQGPPGTVARISLITEGLQTRPIPACP